MATVFAQVIDSLSNLSASQKSELQSEFQQHLDFFEKRFESRKSELLPTLYPSSANSKESDTDKASLLKTWHDEPSIKSDSGQSAPEAKKTAHPPAEADSIDLDSHEDRFRKRKSDESMGDLHNEKPVASESKGKDSAELESSTKEDFTAKCSQLTVKEIRQELKDREIHFAWNLRKYKLIGLLASALADEANAKQIEQARIESENPARLINRKGESVVPEPEILEAIAQPLPKESPDSSGKLSGEELIRKRISALSMHNDSPAITSSTQSNSTHVTTNDSETVGFKNSNLVQLNVPAHVEKQNRLSIDRTKSSRTESKEDIEEELLVGSDEKMAPPVDRKNAENLASNDDDDVGKRRRVSATPENMKGRLSSAAIKFPHFPSISDEPLVSTKIDESLTYTPLKKSNLDDKDSEDVMMDTAEDMDLESNAMPLDSSTVSKSGSVINEVVLGNNRSISDNMSSNGVPGQPHVNQKIETPDMRMIPSATRERAQIFHSEATSDTGAKLHQPARSFPQEFSNVAANEDKNQVCEEAAKEYESAQFLQSTGGTQISSPKLTAEVSVTNTNPFAASIERVESAKLEIQMPTRNNRLESPGITAQDSASNLDKKNNLQEEMEARLRRMSNLPMKTREEEIIREAQSMREEARKRTQQKREQKQTAAVFSGSGTTGSLLSTPGSGGVFVHQNSQAPLGVSANPELKTLAEGVVQAAMKNGAGKEAITGKNAFMKQPITALLKKVGSFRTAKPARLQNQFPAQGLDDQQLQKERELMESKHRLQAKLAGHKFQSQSNSSDKWSIQVASGLQSSFAPKSGAVASARHAQDSIQENINTQVNGTTSNVENHSKIEKVKTPNPQAQSVVNESKQPTHNQKGYKEATIFEKPAAQSKPVSNSGAVPASHPPAWRADDNYEISDKDNSSSDSGSDSDDERPRKQIPEWARRENLIAVLQQQYYGSNRLDPDDIFGAIPACDLETIFKSSKKRYKQRGSSSFWEVDGLTVKENRQYRKDLGLDRS